VTDIVTQAAWFLTAAFALSLVYEVYRATVKAGTSAHDSPASFVKDNVALYVVASVVIGLLFAGVEWAPWVGVVFTAVVIGASIVYYNPKVILDRRPGLIDWFEDLVFTGLLMSLWPCSSTRCWESPSKPEVDEPVTSGHAPVHIGTWPELGLLTNLSARHAGVSTGSGFLTSIATTRTTSSAGMSAAFA
jgi:hypothetical protein